MKSISFGTNNRSGDVLHIEVPGAIVNIRVNLTDRLGRRVTRVDVSPMDNSRSPDEGDRYWRMVDGARIIQDILPPHMTGHPDAMAWECRFCGADIEQGDDGLWADAGQYPADAEPDEAERLACPQAKLRENFYPGLHEPDMTSPAWLAEHQPEPETWTARYHPVTGEYLGDDPASAPNGEYGHPEDAR